MIPKIDPEEVLEGLVQWSSLPTRKWSTENTSNGIAQITRHSTYDPAHDLTITIEEQRSAGSGDAYVLSIVRDGRKLREYRPEIPMYDAVRLSRIMNTVDKVIKRQDEIALNAFEITLQIQGALPVTPYNR